MSTNLTPEVIKETFSMVCKLQDEFNKVVEPNWKENRKPEDWAIAVFVESAELINSMPWKWWKKMELDIENIKIELVDIFHFVLSQLIQLDVSNIDDETAKRIHEIIKALNNSLYVNREEMFIKLKFIRSYVAILNSLVTMMFAISDSSNKKDDSIVILSTFFALIAHFMTYDELIRLYVGKNALNKVRQDYGYKKGTYRKIWCTDNNGKEVEDNVIMQKIVESIPINKLTFEKVYDELVKCYNDDEYLKKYL